MSAGPSRSGSGRTGCGAPEHGAESPADGQRAAGDATPPLRVVSVVAAIIVLAGRMLATQRARGRFAGMWEFPGGKVEAGETPEDALRRELREELDTGVRILGHFATAEHDYPDFHVSLRCYLCALEGGSIRLLEHSGAQWVDGRNALDLQWLPADLPIVRRLAECGVI